MTPKQREKLLRKMHKEMLSQLTLLQTNSLAEIVEFLRLANAIIKEQILDMPTTEWEAYRLPQLQASIRQAMAELAAKIEGTTGPAADAAWQNGIAQVTTPLSAALESDIDVGDMNISTARLIAMRTFMIDRLKDIPESAVGKINAQLGLVNIGAITRHDAIKNIEGLVGEEGRSRAKRIIDTELSRVAEVSKNQSMERAAEVVPGLKKKWRRSGKAQSRKAHDRADGQTVAVNKPFTVNGVKMMHPHDPSAPPKETINCGCKSVMHVEDWNVTNPGNKPFTAEEIALDPNKRG